MRVLVVGSEGREHALAWKLAQSPELEGLHAAPGNPGIAELGSCHPVLADDADGLLALATSLRIDLVVVGPEVPLVAGLADHLRHGGVSVFGPSAAAAHRRLQGLRQGGAGDRGRADGAGPPGGEGAVRGQGRRARGRWWGVFVCHSDEELQAALAEVRRLGGRFLIEELLEGEELSVFALCDGQRAVALAAARDYKRAEDGDAGPNTGGMGPIRRWTASMGSMRSWTRSTAPCWSSSRRAARPSPASSTPA